MERASTAVVRRRRWPIILVATIVALVIPAGVLWLRVSLAPPTYEVMVSPGQTVRLTVEIPLIEPPRAQRSVKCDILTPPDDPGGVVVAVAGAGHDDRVVAAQLRIIASPSARPGRRERALVFTRGEQREALRPRIIIDVVP